MVDSSAALREHLAALTEVLDDWPTDLESVLAVLDTYLTETIPSFLGLTMTFVSEGNVITLGTVDPDGGLSATTVLLPLPVPRGATAGGRVTFFAGNPGAFVDLAADARVAFHLDREVVVDGTRTVPAGARAGVTGLRESTAINQAIGVLIAEGNTPQEASTELRRRSVRAHHSMPSTARRLLRRTSKFFPSPKEAG